MDELTTTRTDPRILRTRRLLRDAFIDLLEEMDLEKISVNRIAERATINRVTFYLHYRDIPDMLEKMADDMIEDINGIINDSPANPNSIEDSDWLDMVNLLEHFAEHAKFYKSVLASKRTTHFRDRLLKLLSKLMADKLENIGSDSYISASGIPKDIALWFGASALIGTIVAWLRKDMPYTPLFLAKQLSLLLPHYYNKEITD
jgi:AcrR family transcriptional regulator